MIAAVEREVEGAERMRPLSDRHKLPNERSMRAHLSSANMQDGALLRRLFPPNNYALVGPIANEYS
jgi:hypothetical protein